MDEFSRNRPEVGVCGSELEAAPPGCDVLDVALALGLSPEDFYRRAVSEGVRFFSVPSGGRPGMFREVLAPDVACELVSREGRRWNCEGCGREGCSASSTC